MSVHAISPEATSLGSTGVASAPSYVFPYFSLKKMLVDSNTAPFMAEAASMAGATNAV